MRSGTGGEEPPMRSPLPAAQRQHQCTHVAPRRREDIESGRWPRGFPARTGPAYRRFRNLAGEKRRLTLGEFPRMSLAEAREKAHREGTSVSSVLRRHVLPAIAERELHSIDRRDLINLLEVVRIPHKVRVADRRGRQQKVIRGGPGTAAESGSERDIKRARALFLQLKPGIAGLH